MDEIHHNGTITNKNRCMIVVSWIVNRYALSIDNKIIKNYSVGNFVHSAHGKYGTDSLCIEISNKSLKFLGGSFASSKHDFTLSLRDMILGI